LKYPLDTDRSGLAQKAESNKTKVTETGGTFKSQIPQEVNKLKTDNQADNNVGQKEVAKQIGTEKKRTRGDMPKKLTAAEEC